MKLTAESTVLDDKKIGDSFATLQVEADGIRTEVGTKVGNNEVISRINQTAETIKIQADKVNIEGATIFTSGRLSQSSLDGAYDASGSATSAVNGLKTDLSSASGTTVINGGHIETGTLSSEKITVGSQTLTTALNGKAAAGAENTANNYITDISNDGIRVHDSHTSNNSIVINSDGMEVFKGGTGSANSVAFYGDTARVGKEASGNNNILINSGGINFRNSTATFGQISASSYTDVVGSDTKFIEMSAKASDNVYANIDISSSTNALSVLSDSTISLNAQKGTAIAGLSVVATNSPFIDGCVTAKGEYVKLEVGARNGLDNSIKATKISDNTTLAELMTSTGNLTIKGTLTQGSDRRLKDHKKYLGDEANDFIKKLKPAYYIKDAQPHVGFYAQDVESIDKWNCMTGEINGFKTLGYTEIIAPLVAYCQHLEKRIEELERSK